MINRDFKGSKQLHPCTACLRYAGNWTAHLRPHAPLLQSPCVLLVQVRTQIHYCATYLSWWHATLKRIAPRTFTVSTHLSFSFPACRRRSPFSVLRTFTVRTHLSFCFSAYPRSSPSSAQRTHAAHLLLPCVPTQLTFFCPAYPRSSLSSTLRTHAAFLHCACVPAAMDNFKTSRITQTVRSTDMIMRQRDLNPSVDSPYLDSDLAHIRYSTQNTHSDKWSPLLYIGKLFLKSWINTTGQNHNNTIPSAKY